MNLEQKLIKQLSERSFDAKRFCAKCQKETTMTVDMKKNSVQCKVCKTKMDANLDVKDAVKNAKKMRML